MDASLREASSFKAVEVSRKPCMISAMITLMTAQGYGDAGGIAGKKLATMTWTRMMNLSMMMMTTKMMLMMMLVMMMARLALVVTVMVLRCSPCCSYYDSLMDCEHISDSDHYPTLPRQQHCTALKPGCLLVARLFLQKFLCPV